MCNRRPRRIAKSRSSGGGGGAGGHGHPRRVQAGARHPGHARGDDPEAPRRAPLRRQDRHQGRTFVAREALMDEAGLLEQGGIGLAQVGGLGRSRQHQQLRT